MPYFYFRTLPELCSTIVAIAATAAERAIERGRAYKFLTISSTILAPSRRIAIFTPTTRIERSHPSDDPHRVARVRLRVSLLLSAFSSCIITVAFYQYPCWSRSTTLDLYYMTHHILYYYGLIAISMLFTYHIPCSVDFNNITSVCHFLPLRSRARTKDDRWVSYLPLGGVKIHSRFLRCMSLPSCPSAKRVTDMQVFGHQLSSYCGNAGMCLRPFIIGFALGIRRLVKLLAQ